VRQSERMRYSFFDEPLENRAAASKAARLGGSVPPIYMENIMELERQGRLEIVVCELQVQGVDEEKGSVKVLVGSELYEFDVIVMACGHRPSCLDIPLLVNLQSKAPVEIVGGFPVLSTNLQWGHYENVFVVGSLASLQIGPDAGNLMGCGRAAKIVTDAMDKKSFPKFKNSTGSVKGWYKTNRFAEGFASLGWESSSSEEEKND
jgi:hypothetical protein